MVDNPPLIEALKKVNSSAAAEIAQRDRSISELRREAKSAKNELVEERAKLATRQEEAGRLEERLKACKEWSADLKKRARLSVVAAWIGTVLVAIGVNYLTSDGKENMGWILILSGVAVEIVAFFVGGGGFGED